MSNYDHTVNVTLEPDECLEFGHPSAGPCSGPVGYHEVPGRFGKAFPRCDAHAAHMWDRYESRDSISRWAHSDLPPHGWSPLDAGERWEDDY